MRDRLAPTPGDGWLFRQNAPTILREMRLSKLLLPPLVLALCASAGCDNGGKAPTAASARPADTPADTTPPKPKGPPQFVVDNIGAKVGFSRILLDKPEGPGQLTAQLADAKSYIDGKDVLLQADRKSKMKAVIMMMSALGKDGAKSITVKTETREEYPDKVKFTPESQISNPEPCTVVAMVLDDRSSAVWHISGTTAIRHGKGLAGPDLSMTGDVIERLAHACKKSSTIFISAADNIEWGLAYDLAASTTKLKKAKFDTVVLLEKTPTAGRKVEL